MLDHGSQDISLLYRYAGNFHEVCTMRYEITPLPTVIRIKNLICGCKLTDSNKNLSTILHILSF